MDFGRILSKLINVAYIAVIVALVAFIGWQVFDTGKGVYGDLTRQEDQMNELYHNQAMLLDYIAEEDMKPTAEYLASVTTFMMGKQGDKDWIGTGVVVAKKNGYYFVITNKHVCNKNVDVCAMINFFTKEPVVLEFVGQPESDADISLWRTNQLPDEQPTVKGMSKTQRQDKVYSIGQYLGMPYVYTEGTHAGFSDKSVLFNLPCAFGCSGSAVFDKQGNLVGLVYAVPAYPLPPLGVQKGVDTNKVYAVPPEVIALFLLQYLA